MAQQKEAPWCFRHLNHYNIILNIIKCFTQSKDSTNDINTKCTSNMWPETNIFIYKIKNKTIYAKYADLKSPWKQQTLNISLQIGFWFYAPSSINTPYFLKSAENEGHRHVNRKNMADGKFTREDVSTVSVLIKASISWYNWMKNTMVLTNSD